MKKLLLLMMAVVMVGCSKEKGADNLPADNLPEGNPPALSGVYKHDSSNVDDPTRSITYDIRDDNTFSQRSLSKYEDRRNYGTWRFVNGKLEMQFKKSTTSRGSKIILEIESNGDLMEGRNFRYSKQR